MSLEQFILYCVAFLRPILFIEIGATNIFDIGGISITLALYVALLARAAVNKVLDLSLVDALIGMFMLWCVIVALIYPENFDLRGFTKLVTPFLCYTVAKNVLLERAQFLRMVQLMVLGYVLPVALSVLFLILGTGAERFGGNYWTGIMRWEGAYAGAHNMGHNMTFLLMLLGIYIALRILSRPQGEATPSSGVMLGLFGLAIGALYCLWMSQVRTALVGLLVFGCVYLMYAHRRILVILLGVGGGAVFVFFPILKPFLFPDLVMAEKTGEGMEVLGSGRQDFWEQNLQLFGDLPLDRQIAGAGIGFTRMQGFIDSHNDILDLLIQTGVVGLILFMALQFAMLHRIKRLETVERNVFRAILIAVLVMNFGSNSYIARFGLAQMFFLVMAYVEIKRRAVLR